jgi:hypothetical protein
MKRIGFLLLAVLTAAGIVAYRAHASAQSDAGSSALASPIYGVKIPDGYRDWQLIAVKQLHFAGRGEQLRAQAGNDIAIKAFKEGTLPFRTAPSSPPFIGLASHQKRTIKSWMARSPARNRS